MFHSVPMHRWRGTWSERGESALAHMRGETCWCCLLTLRKHSRMEKAAAATGHIARYVRVHSSRLPVLLRVHSSRLPMLALARGVSQQRPPRACSHHRHVWLCCTDDAARDDAARDDASTMRNYAAKNLRSCCNYLQLSCNYAQCKALQACHRGPPRPPACVCGEWFNSFHGGLANPGSFVTWFCVGDTRFVV
jgi:hypothetical protein